MNSVRMYEMCKLVNTTIDKCQNVQLQRSFVTGPFHNCPYMGQWQNRLGKTRKSKIQISNVLT